MQERLAHKKLVANLRFFVFHGFALCFYHFRVFKLSVRGLFCDDQPRNGLLRNMPGPTRTDALPFDEK